MRPEDRDRVPSIKYCEKEVSVALVKTKLLYTLVNKTTITPTAFARWENEGLAQQSWNKVMIAPYKCTKSTKLQTFQYQIIHRYIATNKFLFVRGLVDSASCKHCQSIDTIIHYFYACQTVRVFWNRVLQFINKNTYPTRYTPNVSNVLLGIFDASPIVNLLILLAKHYLYVTKSNERIIRIEAYIGYVKSVHDAEMKAASDCDRDVAKAERK